MAERHDPPAAPWADSPEFHAAVAEAAKQAAAEAIGDTLPGLMAQLAIAQREPGLPSDMSLLATHLADLTGRNSDRILAELMSQNSGRIYVPPEILEKRKVARAAMTETILALN